MKPNQAEQVILWERVEENIELVGKINQDLQNTVASKSFQSSFVNSINLQPLNDIKLTSKMLVRSFKNEQLKSSLIQNKLAYLRLNQHKEEKSLQIAKKKFVRLASIRKQSLRERQRMNQIRQSLNCEQEAAIQSKAREVKSSRKTRKDAIEKWHQGLVETAEGIREEKLKFHTICVEQKKQEKQANIKKADRVRRSLEKSRLSIQQSYMLRIETSKQRHRRDLQSRYKQLSHQKKTNEKLYNVFKSETERLSRWQNIKKKQVQQFKSIWIRSRDNPECISVDLEKSRISLC